MGKERYGDFCFFRFGFEGGKLEIRGCGRERGRENGCGDGACLFSFLFLCPFVFKSLASLLFPLAFLLHFGRFGTGTFAVQEARKGREGKE